MDGEHERLMMSLRMNAEIVSHAQCMISFIAFEVMPVHKERLPGDLERLSAYSSSLIGLFQSWLQYPLTRQILYSELLHAGVVEVKRLAVPSNGPIPLQRPANQSCYCVKTTCSTL
jgi:hypothetical protein